MLQPNRHGGESYRYNFQGQETDDEVKGKGNSVNYKYRMHDPRLGRFFAVDPLTPKYPHYSPYSFSGNEVISKVELEGLEPAEHTENYDVTPVDGGDPDEGYVSGDGYTHHCGYVCADGSVSGEGAYKTSDYINFVTSSHTSGSGSGEIFDIYTNNSIITEQVAGIGEKHPLWPIYSGLDPNSPRNKDLFGYLETSFQGHFKSGSGLGVSGAITMLSPEFDILTLGAGTDLKLGFKGLSSLSGRLFYKRTFVYGGDEALFHSSRLGYEKGINNLVVAHGTSNGFIINGIETSTKDVARMMLNSGFQRGTKLRVVSCYTGKLTDGTAYQLSRYLKSPLVAPTGRISVTKSGGFKLWDGGTWATFGK